MSSEMEWISRLAEKHAVPKDAVETLAAALRRSGGSMAQFSHQAFGGMAQWCRSGMTMVGDMFNEDMKARLNALANDVAAEIEHLPDTATDRHSGTGGDATWWPKELGIPSSAGAQNGMRYAIFPKMHRLVIDDTGEITIYDTAAHQIFGISQQQGNSRTLQFESDAGAVRISDLAKVAV